MQNPDEVCLTTPMYMYVVEDWGGGRGISQNGFIEKIKF